MESIFNEDQEKAIELLANGGYTYIEIAKMCGVDTSTLRRWRQKTSFQTRVRDRCREMLKDAEPVLYHAALQQVKKKGSFQHIKILLERLARLEDIADGRGNEYGLMFTWKDKEQEENSLDIG